MNPRGRSGLVGLASVAAPVALFLFLKVTIGLGPSASPAQVSDMNPAAGGPAIGGPSPAPTPEQARALAWLATLTIDADMPSPLGQPEPEPAPVEADVPAAPDLFDGLRLSAVLTTGEGDWATINGKVYGVGDTVPQGYTIRGIDTRAQRVELAGPDGSTRWLSRQD